MREILRHDCKDSRDKFFGVKSLLKDDAGLEPCARESESRIHRHLCVEILQQTASLDMLLFGFYLGDSWVIDWAALRRDSDAERLQKTLEWANPLGTGDIWFSMRYYRRTKQGSRRFFRRMFLANLWAYESFEGPTGASKPMWNRPKLLHDQELEVKGRIVARLTDVNTHLLCLEEKPYRRADLESSISSFRDAIQSLNPSQFDMCVKYLVLVSGFHSNNEDIKSFRSRNTWHEIMQQQEPSVGEIIKQLKRAGFLLDKKIHRLHIHKHLNRLSTTLEERWRVVLAIVPLASASSARTVGKTIT